MSTRPDVLDLMDIALDPLAEVRLSVLVALADQRVENLSAEVPSMATIDANGERGVDVDRTNTNPDGLNTPCR